MLCLEMHLPLFLYRQPRISASRISGSVPINAASLRPGSVTGRTTAATAPMRIPHTAPAGPADPDSSSAGTAAASRRAGNVTWMTTVETTPTSLSMNAVSCYSITIILFNWLKLVKE